MTNRELAQKLNISPAALSLILNHKPGISDSKRSLVLQTLEEMGYAHLIKPVSVAPAVSDNLCFVIYKRHGEILDQHPFFLLMIESIENHAREYGYHILVTTIDNKNPVEPQLSRLKEMNAKGLIIFATEMLEDDIFYFENLQIPFVAIDNDFTHLNINTVSINNQMGTYQAIEYLHGMGHRKIGYLQSSTVIQSFLEREYGYRNALNQLGLELYSKYIFKLPYTEEASYQNFRLLLDEKVELPTAFVTDDDTIASGVIRALTEKGFLIPDDISIVGFNDRPSCEISSPKLTSVNVPRHSFGVESVDFLIKLIERKEQSKAGVRCIKIRIGTQLVLRESVKEI